MSRFLGSIAVGMMLWLSPDAAAQPADHVATVGHYRVTTLLAAPGNRVAINALIEGQGEAGAAAQSGRIATYRMRHAQGAQWDFMLIQPTQGLQHNRSEPVQAMEADFRRAIAKLADFEDDWFVEGPAQPTLKQAYPAAGACLSGCFAPAPA